MAKNDTSNTLVNLNQNQLYPRMAKPEDFHKAPSVPASSGDKLYELTEAQCAPRTTQDGGMGKSGAGTPSIAGTAKGMNPSQNHGEEGTGVSAASVGVDFKSGMHACQNPLPK